jgi:PadR family transcriptional regulator PadR
LRPGHGRGPRSRFRSGPDWRVRARVERFAEPALLLLLRERPTHGYELLDALPELIPAERVDIGNVYRALRALEEEGLVESEWNADLPGPAKRTYSLTEEGRRLLDRWAEALRENQAVVAAFLARYEQGKGGEH